MHKIKAFIPHLFTLGNLFCGCLGIIYAFAWKLDWAAYMVFLAAFLDFFDGFFARILKVPSELGKQLDSLADMVSFGVVPGVVMFQWLKALSIHDFMLGQDVYSNYFGLSPTIGSFEIPWYCYIALIISVFSCYRLAKFNLDTRQSHGFIGLPTPANAIFFVSLLLLVPSILIDPIADTAMDVPSGGWTVYPPLSVRADGSFNTSDIIAGGEMLEAEGRAPTLYQHFYTMNGWLTTLILPVVMNKWILLGLIVLFSLLLVSEIPLFALKFKNFGWNDNRIRYLFLGLAAVLLICFWFTAIPFIVILYLLLSIINNILKITV